MTHPRHALLVLLVGCGSFGSAEEPAKPDASVIDPDSGAVDAATSGSAYTRMVMADGPLLYWTLGEAAGQTTVRDRSGNMLDGTLETGGVRLGSPSLVTDGDTAAELTAGSSIIGLSDPRLAFAGVAPYTLECWLSLTAAPSGSQIVVARAKPTPESGWAIYVQSEVTGIRAYTARYEAGIGVMHATAPSTPLAIGRAHHLAAVYDGTKLTIYLDGVADDFTVTPVALTDRKQRFYVGRSDDTNAGLAAIVDEVAIYGYALGASRIQSHVAAGRSTR